MGRWTKDEHRLFLDALKLYGKDWDAIQNKVKSRDAVHCRSHAQKFQSKLIKVLKGEILEFEETID